MMNFCILTLLLWAIRKLLWLIDSNIMKSAENKIKEVFCFVTDILYFILYFIVEISLGTKTEQAICSQYMQTATENKNTKFNKSVDKKQNSFLLTLLEPITQPCENYENNDNNSANSKVA